MIHIETADTFFDNRPAGIPSDASQPDFDLLAEQALALDPTRYPLSSLKEILRRENDRLNAGNAAKDAIESIDDSTVFVVAGQQAGLFGGPLYACYKAMHAIRLAERLIANTGRTTIPIFWIASDDHDFEEVSHLGLPTVDGEVKTVEYTPASYTDGTPVGDIVLDDGIVEIIDMVAENGRGAGHDQYIRILRDSWRPGVTWADAFASQMLGVFASKPLVVFDPRWKGSKALFRDIFTAELQNPLESAGIVNSAADSFESRTKRKKALRKPPNSTNLFLEADGVRHALLFDGEQFAAGDHTYSHENIQEIVESDPDRLSPAAALRPVCQDAIFPVAALIAGPGERIYLEQTRGLYDHFNVTGSTTWPRASFTLIDRRIKRNATKENIELAMMFGDTEHLLSEIARDSLPEGISTDIDTIKSAVEAGFDSLSSNIEALDPTLTKSIEKDKGRILHVLNGIIERAARAHKSKTAVTTSRFAGANYFLLPEHNAQERWFGMDTLFQVFTMDEFQELLHITSPDEAHHRIITVDG